MSDQQEPPILERTDFNDTREYQKRAIEYFNETQSDFLAIKSYTKQLTQDIGQIRTLSENLLSDSSSLGGQKEKKEYSGTLNLNKIKPIAPGSAFIAKTMWDIQEEQEKRSSGLWKLLGGGLLGGGLIAGAVGMLVSGLFDDGPFKGTKKLAGKVMFELGSAIMKKVLRPFRGLVDNITKVFGDKVLKPFRGFTDKLWKQISKIGDTLLKPFKSVFDNILKFFSGMGGKLFKGMGKGPLGKALSNVAKFVTSKMGKLAKALKFAPGIGSIVGLGFAISRFVNGDILGGTLELAAAIADAVPGIGTAISWGIDILLASRDLGAFKEGGLIKSKLDIGGMFGRVWGWIKEKASALGEAITKWPIIGDLISFVKNVSAGKTEAAIENLAFIATPFSWIASILTGIPESKETKKKLSGMLSGGGEILKKVGSKIIELSSALFSFIGELGQVAIQSAGRGISLASGWLDENVVSPVMGWLGGKINSAIQTAKDIGSWVRNNIINPIGGFFSTIKSNITRGWKAAKGWVQNNLINPVFNFFDTMFGAIDSAIDSVTSWVQEKLIWPIRDFFGTLGNFFSTFKDMGVRDIWNAVRGKSDLFGSSMEANREEQIREKARKELGGEFVRAAARKDDTIGFLKSELQKKGIYYQGISKDVQEVKDAIIKPNGQVIRTSPEDTLIATKNDVDRQSDKEITATVNNMEQYDDRNIQKQNATIIQLLQQLVEKGMSQTNINTVNTQDNKITPKDLTRMLGAEAY